MKICAHCEIAGRDLAYEDSFPLYRRLGAAGVELVMREGAPLCLASTDRDALRAGALARDNGLEISGLTAGYSWSLPLTAGSAETRQAGLQALRRQLEVARLLGTDSLLVVPGYAKTTYVPNGEVTDPAVAVGRAAQSLAEAAGYAQSLGVRLNLEEVWNGMLRTPESMAALIDGIGSPWVGAYFDTGNVYPEGEPLRWIRGLGHRISRVHMKDYQPGAPGLDCFCPLGAGVVNFPAVVSALKAAGYDGWLGAEHHGNRTPEAAAHSLAFLNQLLAKENAL